MPGDGLGHLGVKISYPIALRPLSTNGAVGGGMPHVRMRRAAADDVIGILHKHANAAPGSCNACHRNPLQVAPAGPEHISAARAGHEKGASCDKEGCHSIAGGFYNFKR
jgi:hypothetical protein